MHSLKNRLGIVAVLGALALSACGGSGPDLAVGPVATKLRPTPNGFSFPNFPDSVSPETYDAIDLVAMFGDGACVNRVSTPCEPIAEAAAWARMINQARSAGHCEGLVVQAAQRFNSATQPLTVDLTNQGETTNEIIRSFATQFFPEVQTERNLWATKSMREIVDALGKSLETGLVELTLGLYTPTGGHAVLPYSVEFPDVDNAIVHIYDSNWPGMDRYVEFDLAADQWKFSFSGLDPAADPNAWTGGIGMVDLASLETRKNSTCPFCGEATKVQNSMIIIKSTDKNWSITTANGTYSPSSDAVVAGISSRPILGADGDSTVSEYAVYVDGSDLQMDLPDTASAFVTQGTAIVQALTIGESSAAVKISGSIISADDPNVKLTVASHDFVAAIAGTNTVVNIGETEMKLSTESASGQKFDLVVNAQVPQVSAISAAPGSLEDVADFVITTQTADNKTKVTQVATDGTQTVTELVGEFDLNGVVAVLPDELKSDATKPGLPSLEERNMANPAYGGDSWEVCTLPQFPASWVMSPSGTTCVAPVVGDAAVGTPGSACTQDAEEGIWGYASGQDTVSCILPPALLKLKIIIPSGDICSINPDLAGC